MDRTPREVWEKRVERLRESELTDREFAAEIGANLHTLRSWKWKLAAERRGAVRIKRKRSKPGARTSKTAKATFVEMAIAPAVGIELQVSGVEVRVPVGFDEPTLSRVLAVLRQAS